MDLWLGLVSLFTSTVAGVFGVAGGILLLGALPWALPAHALIPVHAVTQLSSNVSRAWFDRSSIQWTLLMPFLIGSTVGVMVFALALVQYLPDRWVPAVVGIYLLLTLWVDKVDQWLRRYENFYSAGFFQTGLGVVVGATGPLTTALMSRQTTDKNAIVATNALFMFFTHLLKVIVFVFLGFAFSEFLFPMLVLSVGAIAGSWLGSRIRQKVPLTLFGPALKGILTVLALSMCAQPWISS